MPEQLHLFDELSTREGFNRSLRHFKFISRVIGDFERKENLAEILSECLADKSIEQNQILPTLNAVLVDKYGYACRSHNLGESFDGFAAVAAEVGRWRALDLVVVYFHPELGVVTINPKNRSHWDSVQSVKKNEMLTIFAGAFQETGEDKKYTEGIALLIALLEGGKIRTPPAFTKGKFVLKARPPAPVKAPPPRKVARKAKGQAEAPLVAPEAPAPSSLPAYAPAAAAAPAPTPAAAPAPAPAPATTAKRMTPMYSIPVTNELFHNGNVEAWKKIIQSYRTKYSGLDVYVFYEGERIHDINTLFKWGKVKHGSSIMIAVAGDEIKDVAKLQRYLKQGASHMFEAFLKAPVSSVLNLF
jgi:hypothetical protein